MAPREPSWPAGRPMKLLSCKREAGSWVEQQTSGSGCARRLANWRKSAEGRPTCWAAGKRASKRAGGRTSKRARQRANWLGSSLLGRKTSINSPSLGSSSFGRRPLAERGHKWRPFPLAACLCARSTLRPKSPPSCLLLFGPSSLRDHHRQPAPGWPHSGPGRNQCQMDDDDARRRATGDGRRTPDDDDLGGAELPKRRLGGPAPAPAPARTHTHTPTPLMSTQAREQTH